MKLAIRGSRAACAERRSNCSHSRAVFLADSLHIVSLRPPFWGERGKLTLPISLRGKLLLARRLRPRHNQTMLARKSKPVAIRESETRPPAGVCALRQRSDPDNKNSRPKMPRPRKCDAIHPTQCGEMQTVGAIKPTRAWATELSRQQPAKK